MGFAIQRHPEAFSLDPSSKKTRRMEDPMHLAFIRKLPSVISGEYGCEACHIRAASAVHRKKFTGMGQKADDCWVLPLTPSEHKAQHSVNEMEFWRSHGIDPHELAARLYEVTGNTESATRILSRAAGQTGAQDNG